MKDLLDWVLTRRYAVIAVAVIFAPNLSFVSAAVMALQMAYRGPVTAIGDGLIAALAVAIIALVVGGGAPMALTGALAVAMGLLVGGTIRYFRGLTLSFQAIVLVGYALILLYTAFGSTSNAVFDTMAQQFIELLRTQGVSDAELPSTAAFQARLIGVFAISIFFDVLVILLLGYWWLSIARGDIDFGNEFRTLRLGYVLGAIGAIVFIAALVFDYALVHNLFAMAACGFLIQAIAYSHQLVFVNKWHPVVFVPIYLLLVMTFLPFALFGVLGIVPT
jgi:hypothetical protein